MIKIYYLEVNSEDNTEQVRGSEFIHNAILEGTGKPEVRKLIMDTTPDEDVALSALAIKVEEATSQDISSLAALPVSTLPARDLAVEVDELKVRLTRLESK
jgi:hypothetical protein